ncbi:MAG: condensation domain-containing protein, partial [Gemmatimonadaceae bacterium]
MSSVTREQHETFFRTMLGDVTEPTAPYGLLDTQSSGVVRHGRLRVDASLEERVRARARVLGVSVASICHVAWARVVGGLSGRDDVVFGTLVFGRMQGGAGADRGMGLFLNTLPVRIRVGDQAAEPTVRGTHRLLGELLQHEHASLALAQRCSGLSAPTPLFTALLSYRHLPAAKRAPGKVREARAGVQQLMVDDAEVRTTYPLGIRVDDSGDMLGLSAQSMQPADPDRVCGMMHAALEGLVTMLEAAPASSLRDIDVLPVGERHQLVAAWNETTRPYAAEACVHELFEHHAARTPGAIAVMQD